MNVADEFFQCFVEAIKEEVDVLLRHRVLDACDADWAGRGRACILLSILREDTLRYLGLRKLYESRAALVDRPQIKFEPECAVRERGRVDLVLTAEHQEYAFELKRWQGPKEGGEILGKDYRNLTAFIDEAAYRTGHRGSVFSLLFMANEDRDLGQQDKPGFYRSQFDKDLSAKYSLCDLKVLDEWPGSGVTIGVCLATPKVLTVAAQTA